MDGARRMDPAEAQRLLLLHNLRRESVSAVAQAQYWVARDADIAAGRVEVGDACPDRPDQQMLLMPSKRLRRMNGWPPYPARPYDTFCAF